MEDAEIERGFDAAVNVLAVEYLLKTDNKKEYSKRIQQLYKLDAQDIEYLAIILSLNMHIGNLGEMITHGDYDFQKVELFKFLDQRSNEV